MRKIIVVFFVLCVSACSALPLMSFDVADYKDVPPICLNVESFFVESEVMQYDRLPHIEYKMPVTPEQALKNWAKNRFSAVNTDSLLKAILVIKEASMIRRRKPSGNWYTFDNMEYTLSFQVELVFLTKDDQVQYRLSVGGHEMKSIPRKSAPVTKERVWLEMMNAMINKVNDKLVHDLPATYQLIS